MSEEKIHSVNDPNDPTYQMMSNIDNQLRRVFTGVAMEYGPIPPGKVMELMAAALGRLYAQARVFNETFPFPEPTPWQPSDEEIARVAKTFKINADNVGPWHGLKH